MLAKTWESNDKLSFPVVVQEKLDGCPADFYADADGVVHARTRQGHPIQSVTHLLTELTGILSPGEHIIGELYNRDMSFSEISGLVRQSYPNYASTSLNLYVFDFYIDRIKGVWCYEDRMHYFRNSIWPRIKELKNAKRTVGVYIIESYSCQKPDDIDFAERTIKYHNPSYEGIVIRELTGKNTIFKAGWRSPGMIKKKRVETIDLRIASFEEAVDKDGNPKGMVGRINVYYSTGVESDENNDYTTWNVIGVGPGKLTQAERIELWNNRKAFNGRTIEIAYMPDKTYEALREARFMRFRPDKD